MATKKQAPQGKKSPPKAAKKTPASKPASNPFLKAHPDNLWRPGSRTGKRGG
jgi:hypothetical protein